MIPSDERSRAGTSTPTMDRDGPALAAGDFVPFPEAVEDAWFVETRRDMIREANFLLERWQREGHEPAREELVEVLARLRRLCK